VPRGQLRPEEHPQRRAGGRKSRRQIVRSLTRRVRLQADLWRISATITYSCR
jgi:hypothetical protein